MMAPLCVQVTRGPLVESQHQVHAVVLDASGTVVAAWGDVQRLFYPRSAIKMLQALSFVESGAIEKFGLGDQHVAIACASHGGDAEHLAVVKDWLQRIHKDESVLECGAHPPGDPQAYQQLLRQGHSPNRMHNNCSGKHCGLITTALQYGWNPQSYVSWEHPTQSRLRKILSEVSGMDYQSAPWGVDGCGIPTYAISLKTAAASMNLFLQNKLSQDRRFATQRILQSLVKYPHLLGGQHSLCTRVVQVTRGAVIAKTGAEGFYTALMLKKGLSLALKVEDGATRAAQNALLGLLQQFEAISSEQLQSLPEGQWRNVKSWSGQVVGEIRLKTEGE